MTDRQIGSDALQVDLAALPQRRVGQLAQQVDVMPPTLRLPQVGIDVLQVDAVIPTIRGIAAGLGVSADIRPVTTRRAGSTSVLVEYVPATGGTPVRTYWHPGTRTFDIVP